MLIRPAYRQPAMTPRDLSAATTLARGRAGVRLPVAPDHVGVGDQRVEHGLLGRLHPGRAPSLIATLAMMAVAAIYYLLFLARRADWTLHGPVELEG